MFEKNCIAIVISSFKVCTSINELGNEWAMFIIHGVQRGIAFLVHRIWIGAQRYQGVDNTAVSIIVRENLV